MWSKFHERIQEWCQKSWDKIKPLTQIVICWRRIITRELLLEFAGGISANVLIRPPEAIRTHLSCGANILTKHFSVKKEGLAYDILASCLNAPEGSFVAMKSETFCSSVVHFKRKVPSNVSPFLIYQNACYANVLIG